MAYRIITFFIILSSSTLMAQEIEVKVYAGGNYMFERGSWGTDFEEYTYIFDEGSFGFQIGYGLAWSFRENWNIAADFEFTQRTLSERRTTQPPPVPFFFKENYLGLPVSIQGKLFCSFSVGIGFRYDWLIHKQKLRYQNQPSDGAVFSKYDFALRGVLKYQLKPFEISLNYNHGLNKVVEYSGRFSNNEYDKSKRSLIQMNVAYLFE